MKEYWYWYQCAPSSETRGRRAVHDGGCGHWNVRGTNIRLDGRNAIQGSPCVKCGRRMRLNRGIVHCVEDLWEGPFSPLARRNHALQNAEQLNRESRVNVEQEVSNQ